MKSRFNISDDVFSQGSLKAGYDDYEENYKQFGFVLDKDRELVFKEFDVIIKFNIDDIVEINGVWGLLKITHKYYDLDENIMYYDVTNNF